MDLGLTGKVVVVTGASAGIGAAVAQRLAHEGAHVALVARRAERLRELVTGFPAGANAAVLPYDLAESAVIPTIRDEVLARYGTVHGLVNSAGGSRFVAVDAPDEAWAEAFAVNFTAVRRLSHAFLPTMCAQREGRIVNITGSLEPKRLNAANSAKAAVHAWAKGLSRDVGPYGVTINSVSPGRILTEQIVQHVHPTEADRQRFTDANIPLGRFGEPEEIADPIAFLVSPRAAYISGEILHVDGGLRRSAF